MSGTCTKCHRAIESVPVERMGVLYHATFAPRGACRKAAAKPSAVADYNTRIRAEHAQLRAAILELRPSWNREALELVTKSYGSESDPGLGDILLALRAVERLELKFGGAS